MRSMSDIFSIAACLDRGSVCALYFASIIMRIRRFCNFTNRLHLYPHISIP